MMPINNGAGPSSSHQRYATMMEHPIHQPNQHMYPPPSYHHPQQHRMTYRPAAPIPQYHNQSYYEPAPNTTNYYMPPMPVLQQQPHPPTTFTYHTLPPVVHSNLVNFATEETLGRVSPEEFQEYVPGAWDEIRKQRVLTPGKPSIRFRTELDASDVKLVNELGQLSVDNLLDYMKNLQNNAFVLGEDEAKEFQRSKNLGFYKK